MGPHMARGRENSANQSPIADCSAENFKKIRKTEKKTLQWRKP
jgi:hypothetical protein